MIFESVVKLKMIEKTQKRKLVNLRTLRMKRGISQKQLALELGVKPSTICMIENGDNMPSLELAYKIANYFDKSIEEIFYTEIKVI